jgi:hypothetical protein
MPLDEIQGSATSARRQFTDGEPKERMAQAVRLASNSDGGKKNEMRNGFSSSQRGQTVVSL